MKRYAVFAYDYYYPSGGMNDFQQSFDEEHDAFVFAEQLKASHDVVEIEDMNEYE